VRVAVVEAMSQLDVQRVLPALMKLLKDPMWDVRCAAATTLGKLRNRQAVEPLIGVLKDSDNDVREAAANSLGRIGDREAIGPLVLSLADTDPGVRRGATSALRFISPNWQSTEAAQRMSQELRKALESGDLAVRYAATTTLDQIGASATGTLEHEIATVLTAAVQKQNRVLSMFVELLGDGDGDMRFTAATALGNLKDQRAASALKPLLSDTDEAVRRAAAESLAILEIA
jgi:HEAT repeat protein